MIAAVLAGLVLLLLFASNWMLQQQREVKSEIRQQRETYDYYRQATRQPQEPRSLPAEFVEAQQIRQKLLNHPAVTPGPGFNAPGVQRTGISIVQAMEKEAE